jgi:hypothetical protein
MTNRRAPHIAGLKPNEKKAVTCYLTAYDHHTGGDHLLEDYPKRLELIPPAIVVRAFSVELIIKAGLLATVGKCHGHNLSKLFSQLPDSVQRGATMQFKTFQEYSLEQFLLEEKETFIDWRYLHEKQNLKSTPERMRDAFRAIASTLANHFKIFEEAIPYPD